MWLLVLVLALYLGFVYYNSIPSTSPSTSSAPNNKETKKSSKKKKKKKRSDLPVDPPPAQPPAQPGTNNEPPTQQSEKSQGGSSDYSDKEEQVEQKPWSTTTFNNRAWVNLAESEYPSLPATSNRDSYSDTSKEQSFTTIVKKIPLKTEEQWKTMPKKTASTKTPTKAAPTALTKKQRENQRKKDRIKQAKEEEGEMQRQRLNSYRLAQIKAMYSN